MSWRKRVIQAGPVQAAAAAAIAAYLRLVYRTTRWDVVGAEHLERLAGQPLIGAFWHGRIMMMPFLWPAGRPIDILISRHRDGRLISRAMRWFGVGTIDGSTRRGGGAALRLIRRALEQGRSVGITPDGPRGPRMRAQSGIAAAARLTGAPVVPAACAVRWHRTQRSWDRFQLALPGSRGAYVIGPPLDPAAYDGVEPLRQAIEDALNRATAEADRRVGLVPTEPAPLSADPHARA